MKGFIRVISGLILVSVFSITSFAANTNINVSADSAVLYLPETAEFLYSKNADELMPMASTTKIMTALVVLENSELDDLIVIPDEAVGVEGSSAYLKGGERLTVEEMLYALLLQSANDVATAFAYGIGGGIEQFAEMMNSKAESLGLKNTHFTNPHGLDDKEHYTTARELAVIAAAAMNNEDFRKIVSSERKSFITKERSRTYINHNKLLRLYDGCIGVKTGFTKKSGRCLVGAAERDGLLYITVTLDAPNDWSDHEKMLDLGFDSLQKINFCSSLDYCYNIPVIGGEKSSLRVGNVDCRSAIYQAGEVDIKEYVKLTKYLVAPVKKGEMLGEVIFTVDGAESARVPLVALETVKEQKEKGFLDRILSIFK